MERFKIFGYSNLTGKRSFSDIPLESKEIVITDSENLSKFSTFSEVFDFGENDKLRLRFDISEEVNGEINPFLDLVQPHSVIGLNLLDRESTTESDTPKEGAFYLFKVLTRTPVFNSKSLVYSIECEDYASQVYSKQGIGLTIDKTGTIRELAEEILGETRKNKLYRDLNEDVSKLSYRDFAARKDQGFSYNLPYINYRSTTMSHFLASKNQSYMSFIPTDRYVIGEKYDLSVDVVDFRNTQNTGITYLDGFLQVVGVNKVGSQVFVGDLVHIDYKGTARHLRLPFRYSSSVDYLELRLIENTSKKWPTNGQFDISMANFKISRNKDKTTDRSNGETALIINHLDNFDEQFTEKDGSIYSEIKMTLSIDNSNLYNALISLANLFNAEVKFDYQDNAFYFVSKDYRRFNGLRVDPNINLRSISRPESSEELTSIMHLQGGDDVEGAIPPLPKEWRMYLNDCVRNDFSNLSWFSTYSKDNKYINLVDKVSSYIIDEDNRSERVLEIKRFADQMDKIPNFESTLYNFDYFYNSQMLSLKDYNALKDLIYNKVRKLNIALNVYSYQYYSLYSDYSSQLLQINFYLNAINTERKFQYQTHQKVIGDDAPKKYTSAWVSYMNQIDASVAAEQDFIREVRSLMGLREDGHISYDPGSFTYNSLMLFGYKNKDENGIQRLVQENRDKRDKKNSEIQEMMLKIEEIEIQLNDPSVSSFVKESLAVDAAGLRRRIDDANRYTGQTDVDPGAAYFMPGIYTLEGQYYQEILRSIENYPGDIPNILKSGKSLFDLVVNSESDENLVKKKENELQILMDKYEPFALESRYENGDEPDAYTLLDQGLKSFVVFSKPQVSYNISMISISAIDQYSYMGHPEVGDKIALPDDIYLTYDDEDTNYLVVTGYNETLRDFGSLSLSVTKDDETENLLAKMLKESNFIKVKETKKKSNYIVPVPQEIKDNLPNIKSSIEKLKESDLSIRDMFDKMVKK